MRLLVIAVIVGVILLIAITTGCGQKPDVHPHLPVSTTRVTR